MWSDPEMASLERIRTSVNQDIARRMRFGGFFYVLCATTVMVISPLLYSNAWIISLVFFFCALAMLRLSLYQHTCVPKEINQCLIEKAIFITYLLTAASWAVFLFLVLKLEDQVGSTSSLLAIIATIGFTLGGIVVISPRIRLTIAFAALIYLPSLMSLVYFTAPEKAWALIAIGLSYFIFSIVSGKHQHDNYWSAKHQALLLEQQANDLEKARFQAVAASKAKSAFLATMSHEIRTPMNGVLGMTDLLSTTSLTKEQTDYVNVIRNSGETLLHIIDDILDFARIEANKLTIVNRPFQLQTLINEVEWLFRSKAKEKALKFTVNTDVSITNRLIGDPDRIKQILFNLLGNAFKFTNHGEVRLVVVCQPSDQLNQAELRLTVADTGIGITPENQAKLFQEFTQVGESSEHIRGTGLGLVITRNLLSLMNGKIALTSEFGTGSQFCACIPLQCEVNQQEISAVLKKQQSKVAAVLPIKNRYFARVLLVEDNEVNQLISQAMLKRLNCEVTVACNGAEAVNKFLSQSFDLILMDCNMPIMDGFEATERIRAWEMKNNKPEIPIVALTAHAFDEIKERCSEVGMYGHLSKPFDQAQLRNILQKFIHSSSVQENIST